MNVRALGKHLVLALEPLEKEHDAGIVEPDNVSETVRFARIVSRGQDVPSWLEDGNRVLVPSKRLLWRRQNGATYAAIAWKETLAILDRPDDPISIAGGAARHFVPTFWGGHCYYVRKHVQGQQKGKDFWSDRVIGGIYIPQTAVDWSLTVDILAVGPEVGKETTAEYAEGLARPRWLPYPLQVGDAVVCIPQGGGVWRYDWDQLNGGYEAWIEESFVLARVEVPAGSPEDGQENLYVQRFE